MKINRYWALGIFLFLWFSGDINGYCTLLPNFDNFSIPSIYNNKRNTIFILQQTTQVPSQDPEFLYTNYVRNYDHTGAYIIKNKQLEDILNKAINLLGVERIFEFMNKNKELGFFDDFRKYFIYYIKSPYYKDGNLIIPRNFWAGMKKEEREFYELLFEAIQKVSFDEREYIRNYDTLSVRPDIARWPTFYTIENARKKVESILKEREKDMIFSDGEEYKEMSERAVIASIAGFSLEESKAIGDKDKPWYNYVNLNSFISRILYWLRTAEYIPDSNKFEQVSGKAIELLKKLTLWKEERSYHGPGGIHVELKGDIAEIYNALGFSFPAYIGFGSSPGKESYYANWGEDLEFTLSDITTRIERFTTGFGILNKGVKISYDDLKKKVNEIGPAYVFLEGEGFIKIIKIDFPYPGGLFNPLNWLGVIVDYEDALGNIKRIKAKTEFIPKWDGWVYYPDKRSSWGRQLVDFDSRYKSYKYIKNFGEWVINEVDASKALVELSLYNQFTIGGEKTWRFAGFCQSGLWIQFNEEGKKNILNGSVISFDNYLTASENIFYLKIELKEEETGKAIKKLFIPKEKLLFDKWQTFKIPVENVPSGNLTLAVGVIIRYPNSYNPHTAYIAIDNIAIE